VRALYLIFLFADTYCSTTYPLLRFPGVRPPEDATDQQVHSDRNQARCKVARVVHFIVGIVRLRNKSRQTDAIGGHITRLQATLDGNATRGTGRASQTRQIQKADLAINQVFRGWIEGGRDTQVAHGDHAKERHVRGADGIDGRQGKQGKGTRVGGCRAKLIVAVRAKGHKGAGETQFGDDIARALADDVAVGKLLVDQIARRRENGQFEQSQQDGQQGADKVTTSVVLQ